MHVVSRALVLVGAMLLAPAAGWAQQPLEVREMLCRGNEPFWNVKIQASAARASRLVGRGTEETTFTGMLSRLGYLDPPWTVFRGTDRDAPDKILVLVTRAERCLDTMSDEPPFETRAVVSFPDGMVATGCCSSVLALNTNVAPVAEFAQKSAEDWSRWLPDLKAAIERCVADAGSPVEAVTKAWPMNRGMVGVRLRLTSGDRLECIAGREGDGIDRSDLVPPGDGSTLPGEGEPEFLAVRGEPPLFTCGRIERVEATDGRLTGFLHYGGPCVAQVQTLSKPETPPPALPAPR